jgi:predicted helicase
MPALNLKPTHAPVKAYYEALDRFGQGNFDNEGNIRGAFERLLEKCAHQFDWTVVPEYQIARKGQHPIRADAGLIDAFNLPRGYWEAKDSKDDLKAEIHKKFEAGYPRTNILFQSPAHAILYQNGFIAFDDDITIPEKLVDVLRLLFEYREPHIEEWEDAVGKFSLKIPDIAAGAMKLIAAERKTNKAFIERFTAFAEVCRESINPDLKDDAVEKMLVQHLLTERIFRRIFDNSEFTRRNVIAIEIEKVIDSLTQKHFSRDQFLEPLNHFYKAIEDAASQTTSYTEKQAFLNVVYEKFFQNFDRQQADTHGIVYTPQPIVDFMVRSVGEVLKQEFGRSLSDEGVHILDPFVGTGTFITRIMQEIKKTRIEKKYASELHCNEVMLLPYYIASMNIEHTFAEIAGHYEPFEGICLVDTFELAEPEQQGFSFMAEENTLRVKRQKTSPITVVIGNPPYNANQHYENENNRNRRYKVLSKRVAETYGRDSVATNKNTLGDPYVGAFRWASDRVGHEGVVALVTNNAFVDAKAADGIRSNLRKDFDQVFVIDLGGDVRRNPKLSGTTHNVFGIQLGVSISILVRRRGGSRPGQIYLLQLDEYWTGRQKLNFLDQVGGFAGAEFEEIPDNPQSQWITSGADPEYSTLLCFPVDDQGVGLFSQHSNGEQSNRDPWVFSFNQEFLLQNIERLINTYNDERARWTQFPGEKEFESFVNQDEQQIKWCSKLRELFENNVPIRFNAKFVTPAQYRPYTKANLYNDPLLIHRPGKISSFFAKQNQAIVVTCHSQVPFSVQSTKRTTSLDVGGRPSQAFPFYTYDEDGTNRRENVTDWALAEFCTHYGQSAISKWDIFHYTYALLHHPEYRTRYAANLKRELPRIPFAPNFGAYAKIGKKLMDLHIGYEKQPEYPLKRTEVGQLDWKVEKMSLSKDKTKLRYNDFLTLWDIPPDVYEYRLGNRSALEWIVDQYRVSTDARSGIVNDPNRPDDPEYIVRLIGQVITVSLETVKLVHELETLQLLPQNPD